MEQDRLTNHVRRCLEAMRDYHTAMNARINQAMRDGKIISGGQLNGDDWEITDWHTGDLIASGSTGIGGWNETVHRLDPDETWIHIDCLFDQVPVAEVRAERIPQSLGDAIEAWVESSETTDEDIAEIAGWPVEKVREHRTPTSQSDRNG